MFHIIGVFRSKNFFVAPEQIITPKKLDFLCRATGDVSLKTITISIMNRYYYINNS